jgi:xanthine/CO dehydrogenase XdhC/CoxF family maturation factor
VNDARAILAAISTLRASGTPFVVATVVAVRGSSYRRPGARLVATAEGRIAGSISGGCLERHLLRTAFWATRGGPVVVRYDASDDESPLGCGGEVDVLVERAGDGLPPGDDRLRHVERALASEVPAVIATVLRSACAAAPVGARWSLVGDDFSGSEDAGPAALVHAVARACEDAQRTRRASVLRYGDGAQDRVELLIEPIVPPPHLFVFGTGVDAVPVVELAIRLGWRVTLWEPSARAETRARFLATGASLASGELGPLRERIDACGDAVTVVMGHDVRQDARALAMLLPSRASYIGLLGPRHRASKLVTPEGLADPRVHAPVGLDLGAETPDEIALAIVSEILATLRRRTGDALRTRDAIHAPEERVVERAAP